jgi:tRNA(fMet)-specific endonuclease VapC
MKPRYMLDTNICIYLIKHHPPEVARRFAACHVGEVVMSAITYAELDYGAACSGERRSRNAEALSALAADIPVMPFDVEAARAYGDVRLATRERRRDALDKLIAAHAIALGVTLVTNNMADFAGYPGLVAENWVG